MLSIVDECYILSKRCIYEFKLSHTLYVLAVKQVPVLYDIFGNKLLHSIDWVRQFIIIIVKNKKI